MESRRHQNAWVGSVNGMIDHFQQAPQNIHTLARDLSSPFALTIMQCFDGLKTKQKTVQYAVCAGLKANKRSQFCL